MVPTLRGPVVAINGTRVVDMPAIPEGAWVLRGDRGLTFSKTLPPGNKIVAGQWWAGRLFRPAAGLARRRRGGSARAQDRRPADGGRARPADRGADRLVAADRLALAGLQFRDHLCAGDAGKSALTPSWRRSLRPRANRSQQVERALTTELPMVSAIRVREVIDQLSAILVALDRAVRIATGFAILVGVVVLAGSVVATRRSRQRDSVLLKLVGATRREVLTVQLIEFAVLSSAVAAAAFAAGIAGAWAHRPLHVRPVVSARLGDARHPACWRPLRSRFRPPSSPRSLPCPRDRQPPFARFRLTAPKYHPMQLAGISLVQVDRKEGHQWLHIRP